jgi:hypothetical protein
MCSHAYALFSEMRSLDAKSRKTKGQPGRFASAKTSWTRDGEQFVWVTQDPAAPTASIARTASGWNAQVWSDGTADDSLDLGDFQHSKYAMRAIARTINAHVKLAEAGDVEMAGDDNNPYSEDGVPEALIDDHAYDEGPGPGIQESTTKTGSLFTFAEAKTGDDDEGPEEEDSGIEEEEPEDDDESLDEEVAQDEGDGDSEDDQDDEADDGGHDEPHKRDDTDNPGDESDDDGIEKTSFFRRRLEDEGHLDTNPGGMEKESTVSSLQKQYGLSYLAGANYSLSEQARLVGEGEGRTARNRGDLHLAGTHYEAGKEESPEDTLAFLF